MQPFFRIIPRQYAVALLLPLVLSSCGYTQAATLPNNIQTIAISTFEDQVPPAERFAYREGIEIELTNALIDRFIFDGNLKVVEKEKADAVLEGAVVAYKQEGVRFDNLESIEEYRLFLVVSFELIDQRTNEILMSEPYFTGRSEFFVSRTPSSVRRSAANDVVTDLATSLVNFIVEHW